jgi:hypothetical protein
MDGKVEAVIDDLRSLIGRRVEWHGVVCEIVEVLDDGPALVLRSADPDRPVHGDRHGEAVRRAPDNFEVPVAGTDGNAHPDFIALLRLV